MRTATIAPPARTVSWQGVGHDTLTWERSAFAFGGFRIRPKVINVGVRWYLRYEQSYRDVAELLTERGGGLKRLRSGGDRRPAWVLAEHPRGHYELAADASPRLRLAEVFTELALAT